MEKDHELLRRVLRQPEAVHLVYLTSEWVEPLDAKLQLSLQSLAERTSGRVLWQVLRAAEADAERIDTDDFRAICKRFQITMLPQCVLIHGKTLDEIHGTEALSVLKIATTESEARLLARMLDRSLASTLEGLRETNGLPLCAATHEDMVQARREATDLFESGCFLEAANRFLRVLMQSPDCTKSCFNLAVILQTVGDTHLAVSLMLRVVVIDDDDAVAHTVLRSVYFPEEPERVVAGYQSIVAAHPHHVRAVHSLSTLHGKAETAAPAYVQKVFDELAETFEEKLVTHLEYRVPWQLVDALQRQQPKGFGAVESAWRVVDLGCGTGLCGRLLRPFVSHIVGVDVSPLMIEKTRETGFYDELHVADIAPFLTSCSDSSLDLIVSADVWIYVGALSDIFQLCARKLQPKRWLVFSVEELFSADSVDSPADAGASPSVSTAQVEESDGYQLAPSGRFQHTPSYIEALASAHGFVIVLHEHIAVRKESGQPIPGRIYLLQRA